MFKTANLEDEIYRSMEKQLISNQTEDNHGFNKLAKAVDLLNKAAEIFDQAGMITPSKEILDVMQSLATQLQGNK